uniref:Uncharacterized protein n=1 Tax=Marseillevirus LCMAC201 TaxID=2506605 RepID=A0A481YX04_9VIRU|nr:MAG: uncharacterized protein LCMAC201_05620 [Marseillevirus LCMAC201]
MNEEEKENQRKQRECLNDLKKWEMIGNILQRNTRRYTKITDPVIKFSLITQIFANLLDIGFTYGITRIDDEIDKLSEPSVELMDRKTMLITNWETLRDQVESIFDQMMVWIANPNYSPDHPLGKIMMTAAKDDFEQLYNEDSI